MNSDQFWYPKHVSRVKYIKVKKPQKSKIFLIFGEIRSDIFNPTDMFWVSKLVRIHLGTKLNYYHSKPNPNRVSNTIFSPPNFTKSEISFFSFCSGFQALQFLKIWPNCTRNLLTDPLNNSVNWVYASGHLWEENEENNYEGYCFVPIHLRAWGCEFRKSLTWYNDIRNITNLPGLAVSSGKSPNSRQTLLTKYLWGILVAEES